MNGLIFAIAALVAFFIYRTVSAAVKDDKKEAERIMETANNQSPTPSTVTSGSETMGVPAPEPTENESSRSAYDILLAALAEQGCRIIEDEPYQQTEENARSVDFMYCGGNFRAIVSTDTQFFILRFIIPTEVKDELSVLRIANRINYNYTLIKAFVMEHSETHLQTIILTYNCLSVTSDNIVEVMDDILSLFMKVMESLRQLELTTDNQ